MAKSRLLGHWLRARRGVILYVGAVFGLFFLVYGLHGYPWRVAGYAALLGVALGLVLAVHDITRFAARHTAMARLAGCFPTGPLPPAHTLPQQDAQQLIAALEAERARLAAENEATRRDAEEYYTLWAHQVKTPLAAMGLLLQSGAPGLAADAQAELEQQLFRIGQYVNMVLGYQRLSSVESDLLLERAELSGLVNQAAKSCAPLFIHRGLALHTAGVQGQVVTDRKWFCFVLEQLLANAAKYTAKGTVRVYTTPGDVLVVEDSGCGIPPEDLPRVFQHGFTGAVGRTQRSSTGIGLYLCRRILGLLGFAISIQSQPGRGTRVLLLLAQGRLALD